MMVLSWYNASCAATGLTLAAPVSPLAVRRRPFLNVTTASPLVNQTPESNLLRALPVQKLLHHQSCPSPLQPLSNPGLPLNRHLNIQSPPHSRSPPVGHKVRVTPLLLFLIWASPLLVFVLLATPALPVTMLPPRSMPMLTSWSNGSLIWNHDLKMRINLSDYRFWLWSNEQLSSSRSFLVMNTRARAILVIPLTTVTLNNIAAETTPLTLALPRDQPDLDQPPPVIHW